MQHVRLVEIFNGTEQIVDDMLSVLHLEVDIGLNDFLQVALCVLHHNVESVKGLWIAGIEKLNELDDKGMLQFSHKSDLTKNTLAVRFVLKYVLHSLDCDFLPSASPSCKGNFTIAASSK